MLFKQQFKSGLMLWLTAMALGLFSGCELLAGKGGGTETESNMQVAGKPVNADGSPAIGARVIVRAADYVADPNLKTPFVDTNLETVVNADGWFRFKNIPTGSFRLEVTGTDSNGLIHDFELLKKNSGLELAALKLAAQGTVTGMFKADSAVGFVRYVQVVGLEKWVKTDSVGKFSIPNLPAGNYTLHCATTQPFRGDTLIKNIIVTSAINTPLTQITLVQKPKLVNSVDGIGLKIEGMVASNPVIMDNELWTHEISEQYLWSQASLGLINVRGNIVTNDMGGKQKTTMQEQMFFCKSEMHQAQSEGMINLVDPVFGATSPLKLTASQLWSDLKATSSVGSDLIVSEARKATLDKPLIVIEGGPLTTVANAFLTDPTIAPKMVVVGIYPHDINSFDTLATQLVIKNCRFVEWGRKYIWQGALDPNLILNIPATSIWKNTYNNLFFAKDTLNFGDVAPAVYLINRGVWKSKENLVLGPDGNPLISTDSNYEYISIPLNANDFSLYQKEVFSTLSNPKIFKPKNLPGIVNADGFLDNNNATLVVVDSGAGIMGVTYTTVTWTDHNVSVGAAKKFAVTIRYRSVAGAIIHLGVSGQPSLLDVTLPPAANWSEVQADSLNLPTGDFKLRVQSTNGIFDLDHLDIH